MLWHVVKLYPLANSQHALTRRGGIVRSHLRRQSNLAGLGDELAIKAWGGKMEEKAGCHPYFWTELLSLGRWGRLREEQDIGEGKNSVLDMLSLSPLSHPGTKC